MDLDEAQIERWLNRGSKFLRTVARNPVVRATLAPRGLTDEELERGWQLYTRLHGFGTETKARPASDETAAGQAMNEIDAWDAPAYGAARAVLEVRFPEVDRFLFENLSASEGTPAVAGVRLFLARIAELREGKAAGIPAETGKSAVELLAARKILEPKREAELKALLATAERGAQPSEVVPERGLDPERGQIAQAFVAWLHEWREVARMAISRRDYRISLGLAQRRRSVANSETDDGEEESTAAANGPRAASQ